MRSLLAIALLAATASSDSASCRVLAQPTDWAVTRNMLPAGGPFSTLHVEACAYFEQTVGFEQVNPLNLVGCRWSATNLGIIVDISFDPAFAPGFEVVPSFTVMLPDAFGRVGPYDGVIDFAGSSGQTIAHENTALATADLSILDPTFFQSSWPLYIRTRTLPYVQNSNAGAMVFSSVAEAGVGVVVTYQ